MDSRFNGCWSTLHVSYPASCLDENRVKVHVSNIRAFPRFVKRGGNIRLWEVLLVIVFATQPFGLIRDHWAIENRLHGRRDVTLGEDRCGVRVPAVAQMLAVLNSLILSLMDFHHVSNVARQLRSFSSHPEEALAWLL
jgi:hypothetical protein